VSAMHLLPTKSRADPSKQKRCFVRNREDSEADTLLAFVSMGGDIEGEGKVDVARLKKVTDRARDLLKACYSSCQREYSLLRSILTFAQTCQDFGLTIDIDNLIKDVDVDKDGHVGFSEFKTILTSPTKKPYRSANGDVPPEHSLLSALRKGRGGSFMPGLHTADEADYDSDGP